jgi:hypothetical protein
MRYGFAASVACAAALCTPARPTAAVTAAPVTPRMKCRLLSIPPPCSDSELPSQQAHPRYGQPRRSCIAFSMRSYSQASNLTRLGSIVTFRCGAFDHSAVREFAGPQGTKCDRQRGTGRSPDMRCRNYIVRTGPHLARIFARRTKQHTTSIERLYRFRARGDRFAGRKTCRDRNPEPALIDQNQSGLSRHHLSIRLRQSPAARRHRARR